MTLNRGMTIQAYLHRAVIAQTRKNNPEFHPKIEEVFVQDKDTQESAPAPSKTITVKDIKRKRKVVHD